MIHLPHYHNPLAAAMPPGFENARVSVNVTSENFADVMAVVTDMVRAGADFIAPPLDENLNAYDALDGHGEAEAVEASDEASAPLVRARKATGRPKLVPSPDTITPTTPLRLEIAARIAFPDGSIGVSGLRREIQRGSLRAEMIARKQFTTLADIETMRKKCAVPTKARDSSSETPVGGENPIGGSFSIAMPADVASSARQAHLRQTAQRLRASGQTPKRSLPTISDESTSRNSGAVIRFKSE
jgi:hypothetical protein